MSKIWKGSPDQADFAAAECYLTLLCSARRAHALVRQLRRRWSRDYEAKDLLRASGLPLFATRGAADLKRVRKGKLLSPVMIVQGDLAVGRLMVIADGYHRVCAVYYHDEDAAIACRVAAV